MKPSDKQKNTPPAAVRPKAKAGDKAKGGSPGKFMAIAFNLLAAVVSIVFLNAFFQHNDPDPSQHGETHMNAGYDWLMNSMLKGNMDLIEKKSQ